MKKIGLFIAVLSVIAGFAAINKVSLPYVISSSTSPKVAWIDANDQALRNGTNKTIDSTNRLRDTVNKYIYKRGFTGTGSVVYSNTPTILTPVIGSITGVGGSVSLASGDTLKADVISTDLGKVNTIEAANADFADLQATSGSITSLTITNLTGATKAHVGLSNVDNTSDLNKPISTATQTALNTKANNLVASFTRGAITGEGWANIVSTTLPASSTTTVAWIFNVIQTGDGSLTNQRVGVLKVLWRNGSISGSEFVSLSGTVGVSFGYTGTLATGSAFNIYAYNSAFPFISIECVINGGGFVSAGGSFSSTNPSMTAFDTKEVRGESYNDSRYARLAGATYTGDVSTKTEVKQIREISSTGTTTLDKSYSYIVHTGSSGSMTLPAATGSGFVYHIVSSNSSNKTITTPSGTLFNGAHVCGSPSAANIIYIGQTFVSDCGSGGKDLYPPLGVTIVDCLSGYWCYNNGGANF